MSRRTAPSPLPIIRACLASAGVGGASVEVFRRGSGFEVEVDCREIDADAVEAALRTAEAEYRARTTPRSRRW